MSSGETDDLLRELARIPEVEPRPPEPDRVGEVIDHFKIISLLGQGGMGVVYAADDLHLRRRVALKLLPASRTRDPQRRTRFMGEARAAATVIHENLGVVFEVGESGELIFIAMELIEGTTLRVSLAHHKQRWPRGQVLEVAKSIVRGVAAAHAAGVVHRDLKPENVMIASTGSVKVLDFGLATSFGDAASAREDGQVMGTPGYMSPEQARGEAVDARTDVYALGVILEELLGRRSPKDPLSRLIARCRSERPDDRPRDAGELLVELEAVRLPPRLWPAIAVLALLSVASIAAYLGTRGECSTHADCASGRCASGRCVAWSGTTSSDRTSLTGLVFAADHDLVIAGTFSGALDYGCGAMSAEGAADLLVTKLGKTGSCVWAKTFDAGRRTRVRLLETTSGGHTQVDYLDLERSVLKRIELDAFGALLRSSELGREDVPQEPKLSAIDPRGDQIIFERTALGTLSISRRAQGTGVVLERLEVRGGELTPIALAVDPKTRNIAILGAFSGEVTIAGRTIRAERGDFFASLGTRLSE